ncbi:MAG: DUF1858 domain-containing protein [Candidatus Aminicenantes bacterium]|nr:DUF1858 domain-containing protein [Candidatus Aminicenantes bacterium]
MENKPELTLEIEIEDLVRHYPLSAGFLIEKGVRCIRCGEPVWGTLGKLLEEDRIENPAQLLDELKQHLAGAGKP